MEIRKDIEKLKKEAEQGNVGAKIILAYHYLYAFNIHKDLQKAYEIFSSLAEEGYEYANDAMQCFSSKGSLTNEFKSIYGTLREAILFWNKGNIVHESQDSGIQDLLLMNSIKHHRLLAHCCLDGYGVPKDEYEGFWLFKYLYEKIDFCDEELAYCYLDGIGTEVDENKGFSLLNKIHKEDPQNASVIYHLAMCYINGKGADTDFTKARLLLEDAAKKGCYIAYQDLGLMYRHGEGVPVDMDKAIEYYKKGLKHGVGVCATNLGVVYQYGINGYPKNAKLALDTFLRGVELGDRDSMFNAGCIYYNGELCNQQPDYERAIRYFQMAAGMEEPDSIFHLGLCYLKGNGVECDETKAINYFIYAANLGHQRSQELLEENNIDWNSMA